MRHFTPSHHLPSVLLRVPLVSLVSTVRIVPSLPLSVRAAAARVPCLRLASGGPFVAPALVPALPPQASAWSGSRGYRVAFTRPLSLGRAVRVTLVRRVSSSARRGRRSASANFHATGVACGGGGFACVGRGAASALALARIPPASRVNRSGPTHRSRGAAPKAAQPPQLTRWASR